MRQLTQHNFEAFAPVNPKIKHNGHFKYHVCSPESVARHVKPEQLRVNLAGIKKPENHSLDSGAVI